MLGEVGGLGCAVTDFLEFLQSFVGTHGSNARNQIPDVSRVVVDCFVHQLFSAITTTNTMIPIKTVTERTLDAIIGVKCRAVIRAEFGSPDQGSVDNGWPLRLIFFFQQKWTMSFHDGNHLILTPIIPSWKEHER